MSEKAEEREGSLLVIENIAFKSPCGDSDFCTE
jgi:hypothetical protein